MDCRATGSGVTVMDWSPTGGMVKCSLPRSGLRLKFWSVVAFVTRVVGERVGQAARLVFRLVPCR